MIPYSALDAIDAMHMTYEVNARDRRSHLMYAWLPSVIALLVALIPWAIAGLLLTS
jgi:hypothetical protein